MFLEARPKTKRKENKNVFLEAKVRVKLGHPVFERLEAQAATVRNKPGIPLGTASQLCLHFVLFCPWKLKSMWHKKGKEPGA